MTHHEAEGEEVLDDEWDAADDDEGEEEDEEEEDDEDDDVEDTPEHVFVGMAFDREGCDECWRVLRRACRRCGLEALRAHPDEILGSQDGDDIVHALLDLADFAVIDLTHERPSVAHEIGMADRELPRHFILLVARTGTPRFANIQGRTVHYYADTRQLERLVDDQLSEMLRVWFEADEDEEDEEGTSR